MDNSVKSQTPNQVVLQIIIPFFLTFILILVVGYLIFIQINGGNLELAILADISLILLFIPIFLLMILALLLFVFLNIFAINFSKPLMKKLIALKNKISYFEHVVGEISNRMLSPLIKLESFHDIFNFIKTKRF